MRKILNFMTGFTLLFFFVFLAITFYIEKNSNFLSDKIIISLEPKYDCMHDEYINRIEDACRKANTDVTFVYYKYDEHSGNISEIELYTTNNRAGFLPFGESFLPDEEKSYSTNNIVNSKDDSCDDIYYPCYIYNYKVHPLNKLSSYAEKKSVCLTDRSTLMKLSETMTENYINVADEGDFILKDATFSNIFKVGITVSMFLLIISMMFYQFSISKKNAIRLLEGYDSFSIIVDEVKLYLHIYIIEYIISVLLISILISLINSIQLVFIFFSENINAVIFVSLLIPLAFVFSNLYTMFVKPLEIMKGKKYNKVISVITFIAKQPVIMLLIVLISTLINSLAECRSEYNVYKNTLEYLKNYHSITITERFVDEEKYVEFYKLVHKRFTAIMMTAHYCCNKDMEGDINQWYIYVNDNYLELNPVIDENGNKISYEKLPKDKRTILVPHSLVTKESEIIAKYASKIKVTPEIINIVYYDDNQKFLICSATDSSTNDGYIMHPIVIIHENGDNVSGAISNGELVFKGRTDNFYSEIKPYLIDCDIESSTGTVINVSDEIKSIINQRLIEIIALLFASVFLLVIMLIVIVYESWIYYVQNKKEFAIKKLDGYNFNDIHAKYIWAKVCTYVLLVVFGVLSDSNISVSLSVCLFDYIVFYGLLEFRTVDGLPEVLKGE